jgi:galactoside O-acetyltransferase
MLGPTQLRELGVAEVGENVLVDPTARLIGVERMRIGSNVRIDAFGLLSAGDGGITIGNYVHVAAHAFMSGSAAIVLEDYVGLSGRVSVYSSSDDYSGIAMAGPMLPPEVRAVESAPVTFHRHALVGAGCVVLPGAVLEEGAAVGAMSLVTGTVPTFELHAGIPARRIGDRSRQLLDLERSLAH